jgi:hypothetical protein
MSRKAEKERYTLEVQRFSDLPALNAHLKKNKKMGFLKKALSLVGVFLFASGTIAFSSTTQANALNPEACYLAETEENEWIGLLGGMTTYAHSNLDDAKNRSHFPSDAVTMSEKYNDVMEFSGWMPAIRSEKGGSHALFSSIPENTTWTSLQNGGHRSIGKSEGAALTDSPIRIGEAGTNAIAGWPFENWIGCSPYVTGEKFNVAWSNFVLSGAKSLTSLASDIYINANSSTNITQVVQFNANPTGSDDIFETDTNYKSWAYDLGVAIESFLLGTNGNPGLYNTLFLDWLFPIIFIGALVVLVNAIRSRAIKALGGIVWMFVIIALGIVVLQRPMFIPTVVDAAVGTVTTGVQEAIFGGEGVIPGCAHNDPIDARRVAKETQCYIWYETVYRSWVEGQFGVDYSNPTQLAYLTSDPQGVLNTPINVSPTNQVSPKDVDNLGWGLYQLEYGHTPAGGNVALAQNAAGNVNWFDAEGTREGSAWGALFAAGALSIFLGVNSLLIIAYQLSMLMLLFVAPVFFLIGIIPSATGKGIFFRWMELITSIAAKRAVIALIMGIFLKLFLMIAAINTIDTFMKIVLFAVLTFIVMKQRGKIFEMFVGRINFGGDKSINIGGRLEKAAEVAPAMVSGKAKQLAGSTVDKVGLATKTATVGKFKRRMADNENTKIERSAEKEIRDRGITDKKEASAIREKYYRDAQEKTIRKSQEQQLASGKSTVKDVRARRTMANYEVLKDERQHSEVISKMDSLNNAASATTDVPKPKSKYTGKQNNQRRKNRRR